MSDSATQLGYFRDPRISAHAVTPEPAWLWSADGTQILWANAVGAAIFGAETPAALAGHRFDPQDSVAQQIARIAAVLPADGIPRLERLSGLGAEASCSLPCGCSRISLPDGTAAILVVAAETAGPSLPLEERAQRLLAGLHAPVAIFAADGRLFHANQAGAEQLPAAASFDRLGADALATHALRAGYASGASKIGPLSFDRIGDDAAVFLIVRLPALHAASQSAPASTPAISAPPPGQADVFAPEAADDAEMSGDGDATHITTPAQPPEVAPPAPVMPERRQPLRFVWKMDTEGRLAIESEDFIRLTGPRTAQALGQPWSETVRQLGIDPNGQIAKAIASRDTWSGITIDWPVDGTDERLAVELSGLPVFDRDRHFGAYRGFGVCRDARRVFVAASLRQAPAPTPEPPVPPAETSLQDRPAEEHPVLTVVPQAENVVPFRTANDKPPSLSPGERSAFHELAKELTSRLQRNNGAPEAPLENDNFEDEAALEPPLSGDEDGGAEASVMGFIPPREAAERQRPPAADFPGSFRDDRSILDRVPTGVLVYRIDMPLYVNPAFLEWSGYESVGALIAAGGLDVLFVELGDQSADADAKGRLLRVASDRSKQQPSEGRLFNAPWDGEVAHVLMLLPAPAASLAATIPASPDAAPHPAPHAAEAEVRELKAILDTASDGVLVLDEEGHILSANASAEGLFGRDASALAAISIDDLIAPESQRAAREYLAETMREGAAPKKGCEVIGRGREGSLLPLFMTLGRLVDTKRHCAVFRDLTSWKKTEMELVTARRQAEKASAAKSEFLAKVSHEIRTPLNSIIGFSEVMMDERFGPIGNERYKQYLKDVHQSGAHLVSLLNDLLDLSKIEAGRLDLSFGRVSLNELTQQCVSLMQPQANQERVIIRTSLPDMLPPIMADARSVRQIVFNLLSNSIKFTGAGGQVIVSTTHTDEGEVVLRVRDTGHGMTEKEIQMALEPFRQLATSSRLGSGGTGLGLPLTKALVEANRANFSIKSALNAGTLVEISFPPGRVLVA
jgi:PAS domain S-box-containing protein